MGRSETGEWIGVVTFLVARSDGTTRQGVDD
jgi:hypothetical protein